MSNETRYSILRPLTEHEQQFFAFRMFSFFSPLNYRRICKEMSWEEDKRSIRPFSIGKFLTYLEKSVGFPEPHKYMHHIQLLARKLSEHGVLTPAGNDTSAPGINQCYYTMKELTNLEGGNGFWLGNILGERYLRKQLAPYIVRIEGDNSEGIPGTGSGVLIASNCILTCRHNIRDMEITSCWLGDQELKIAETLTHPKYDVGIIKIAPAVKQTVFPYLGPPYFLDKTLTLGYPPLRGMREPLLLAQSGEINAIGTEVFSGCECITISSITRPGNSGGPVFSLQGYIVGIVIEGATSVSSTTSSDTGTDSKVQFKMESPFYLAISSNTLRTAITEIDPSILVEFENYK